MLLKCGLEVYGIIYKITNKINNIYEDFKRLKDILDL